MILEVGYLILLRYQFLVNMFSGNASVNGAYNYNESTGLHSYLIVIFSNGYNNDSSIVMQGEDYRLSSVASTSYYTSCHAIFSTTDFILKEISSVGYSGFTVKKVYGIH